MEDVTMSANFRHYWIPLVVYRESHRPENPIVLCLVDDTTEIPNNSTYHANVAEVNTSADPKENLGTHELEVFESTSQLKLQGIPVRHCEVDRDTGLATKRSSDQSADDSLWETTLTSIARKGLRDFSNVV